MKQLHAFIGVLTIVLLGLVAPAPAQVDPTVGEDDPNSPTAVQPIPRASASTTGTGEISITVRSFGIGNSPRAGDWLGVLLDINDSSSKARNVAVRLSAPDLDGDIAQMQRVIVANPGAIQQVWLYFRPSFSGLVNNEFEFTAHEAVEDEVSPTAGQTYTIGRLLGRTRYIVNNAVDPYTGIVGIIGGRAGGIEQYANVRDGVGAAYAVTGHEVTDIIAQLKPRDLPDRWMGYTQLQAIVWTGGSSDEDPTNLDASRANAIREYVRRGGHLVIVLPPVGQKWIGNASLPLADIMPPVNITRVEGADLNTYRSLLTRDAVAALPKDAIVQILEPASPGSLDAIPIMVGEDGKPVVVRRLVGSGMVTVIGLDVTSPRLHSVSRAIMTDQFWNRILGKRLRVLSGAEMNAMQNLNKKMPNGEFPPNFAYQKAGDANVDARISAAITNEARAASGLLLACVVFLGYWLVAGPLGYFVLKQRNWKQHSWIAFVGATAVFTVVAWGGANLLKPRRVHGQHFTVVDGVFGQTSQRARTWASVFLPRYGEQTISAASTPGTGADWINTVTSWDAAGATSGGFSVFPDSRGYVVDARKPDTITVPARATSKQVQIDWAGVLPATWQLPRPLADASVPLGREVTLSENADAPSGERKWKINGSVVHNLPAPLKNVYVLAVLRPQLPTFDAPPNTRMFTVMTKLSGAWAPNQSLPIDDVFEKKISMVTSEILQNVVPKPSLGAMQSYTGQLDAQDADLAMSFFDMLPPPLEMPQNGNEARVVMRRLASHTLDLSRYFTQPCIIIIGEIGSDDPAECPIPFSVDDLAPDELRPRIKGRTLVRWVYPLAPDPVRPVTLRPPPPPPAPPASGDNAQPTE